MVYLWDLETRKPLATLEGFGPISYLQYAPDGKSIALGTEDGKVGVWDTTEPRKVLHMPLRHPQRVHRLSYSPDCKTLVSTDEKGNLVFWDVGRGTPTQERAEVGAMSVAFSPKGGTLAVGYQNGEIRLWDAVGRKEKQLLKGHERAVLMLTYSPDGTALASCSADRTVRVWNVSKVGE
jgi:WD40 repeat protein